MTMGKMMAFPVWDQGHGFEAFVHGPETTREKGRRVGLLHKREFAGEEILEVDQLGIAFDVAVRSGLKRELNAQSEAVPGPAPEAPRLHDAGTRARDRHEIVLGHAAAELHGGVIPGSPGLVRAEPKTVILRRFR